MSDTIRLHKHQAVGNDFLVLVATEDDTPLDGELARWVCDRYLGAGADGLMAVGLSGEEGVDLTMVLRNADGSVAEMSGNGLRCLVQAARRAGLTESDDVVVRTGAGLRRVRWEGSTQPGTDELVAAMGPVTIVGEAPEWVSAGVQQAALADIGNPHLVLHVPSPDTGPDLHEVGVLANEKIEGGINVELIAPDGAGGLVMAVYERGVGPTLACGTGACASAAVARSWGLVGDEVAVHSPGGVSRILFESGETSLGGPVSWIADLDHSTP
jgi:diaminopimelate epimerase